MLATKGMSQLAFQPAYTAEKALRPAKVCVTGVTGFVAGEVTCKARACQGLHLMRARNVMDGQERPEPLGAAGIAHHRTGPCAQARWSRGCWS